VSAERERVAGFGRLEDGLRQAGEWYQWGPYVSERQWGTVREDYSPDGEAWGYLPHEHARSRAYRWGEDGLAGFCDIEQRLCLGLALWNGTDPILKERAFGLTGPQGNHGEDVKEHWWYLDALPSHAWNRWRYHYPQAAFPYEELISENAARSRLQPEYELIDTGVFDSGRYWVTEVHYAKADPGDLLMAISVTNAGPEPATLHVLPTAWFRNTWSWDESEPRPALAAIGDSAVAAAHPFLGPLELIAGPGPDGSVPRLLFCENETNARRLFGAVPVTPYPKDGINDHVVSGAATVNPAGQGTKCAFWYQVTARPGETIELRLRLRPGGSGPAPREALGADFDRVIARRSAEADEFYAELTPAGATADETMIMRQAFAGMLWSKQLYYYDVARWLDGDPAQPPPAAVRKAGRNSRWRHFDAFDIMSMPDKWEYPWFAAWDLGSRDIGFLSRVFDKLLINFTWWVNREDSEGNNLFEGGFLGLDNIGPIDRSHLPVGGVLEQSDATGWMGFFSMAMASIAVVLHRSGQRPGLDLVLKFLEHFAAIRDALDGQGLWDDADGLYYDRLITPGGDGVPVRVRSIVGIIPALAVGVVDESMLARSLVVGKQFASLLRAHDMRDPAKLAASGLLRGAPGDQRLLLSLVGLDRLRPLLARLFDEAEFLSPHGLRALSAYHREHPYEIDVEGYRATIDYEPAESTTPLFGGNSNWRGPVWFPVNYLVISMLERYHQFFGDELTIEYPTGSGRLLTLDLIAGDLRDRLISIFTRGPDGRRACFGGTGLLQGNPAWRDNVVFSEYFDGDNGSGLGASHQTGWTGLIADMIRRRHGGPPGQS
jgi:hypothetical protein